MPRNSSPSSMFQLHHRFWDSAYRRERKSDTLGSVGFGVDYVTGREPGTIFSAGGTAPALRGGAVSEEHMVTAPAFGAHWDGSGTHFAVWSSAERVELCLF